MPPSPTPVCTLGGRGGGPHEPPPCPPFAPLPMRVGCRGGGAPIRAWTRTGARTGAIAGTARMGTGTQAARRAPLPSFACGGKRGPCENTPLTLPPSFHARAMGPRGTRGQHANGGGALAKKQRPSRTTTPCTSRIPGPSAPHLSHAALHTSPRGRAHTSFPQAARACDRGAMQRERARGGAVGRHARSEESAHTPLLYHRRGGTRPPAPPFKTEGRLGLLF